jgi:predicted secreted protein
MRIKKCYGFIVAVALVVSPVWAGDTASFVDFGFSPDGATYMFGQYGIQSQTLKPWADLYVVDVARNDFVSGGKLSFTHNSAVVAGQDGSGALYGLIARNAALADRYRLNFLLQGQLLYLSLDANPPPSENIEFRDFERNTAYKAHLLPALEGSGVSLKSSFYISLERTLANGTKRVYTVGNPQVKRPLINAYRIKKVMVAPRGGAIVFVVSTTTPTANGPDVRYMVETLSLE